MDLGIDGRTALVTGADSGIGWHTAKMLLAEGVRVVISDKDQSSLDEAAAQLEAPEGQLFAFAADVTDTEAVENLAVRTQQAVGDIDILVQSSGVTGAQGLFHEIDEDGWNSTLDVDLMGPVRLLRAFVPALRRGGCAAHARASSANPIPVVGGCSAERPGTPIPVVRRCSLLNDRRSS